MTEIPSKIRLLRIHIGYSQEFMALQLGISQRAYSKIETSQTKLTLERLGQICRILNCKPEAVMSLPFRELVESKS